jgi:hypothetical protein
LKENELESGEKPIVVQLQHAADGIAIPNPTTEYTPFFYQYTIEKFFKWILSLKTIMEGHTVRARQGVSSVS